jgi:hypothetical protein
MLFTEDLRLRVFTVLGQPAENSPHCLVWNLGGHLSLTVTFSEVQQQPNHWIVTVQSMLGIIELHNVYTLMIVEPDEVMVIATVNDQFSSMVIGASGTCSVFANVDQSLTQIPITEVPPEQLLAAMQVSLAEHVVVQ